MMNQKTQTSDSNTQGADSVMRAVNTCEMPDPRVIDRELRLMLDSETEKTNFLEGRIRQRNNDLARQGARRERAESALAELQMEERNRMRYLLSIFGLSGIDLDAQGVHHDTRAMAQMLHDNIRAVCSAFYAALPILHHVANPDNWSGQILPGPQGKDVTTQEWADKGLDVIRGLVPQYFAKVEPTPAPQPQRGEGN
jgi:hypothetical protein